MIKQPWIKHAVISGSTDNTYFNLDNAGYQRHLNQKCLLSSIETGNILV